MTIRVEACWGGKHSFRLTLPDGSRLVITVDEGQGWCRAIATRALNLLAIEYPHVSRRSIRFSVR